MMKFRLHRSFNNTPFLLLWIAFSSLYIMMALLVDIGDGYIMFSVVRYRPKKLSTKTGTIHRLYQKMKTNDDEHHDELLLDNKNSTLNDDDDDDDDHSHHIKFMKMAMDQAKLAERKGEVPIGAVVVERLQDGSYHVLSQAHNAMETTHDASAHAELLALRKASTRIKNWRLLNTTLYSTLEPCPMCLSAGLAFRVSTIVYGAPDLNLGAIQTHMRMLDDYVHPTHTIKEVISGVLEEESSNLMRSFFRKRRKQQGRTMPPPRRTQKQKIASVLNSMKHKLKKIRHFLSSGRGK
jgi:tRNA(adenine34) deaminase